MGPGLLAGGALGGGGGGGGGGGSGGGNGWSGVTPGPDRPPAGDAGAAIGAWFATNLGLVIAIGATIVVLALVLLALSFIAQAA
jgi:hypothetical protein